MKNSLKFNGEAYGYLTHVVVKTIVILLFSLFLCKLSSAQSSMPKLSIHLLLNTNGGSSNTADGCLLLYSSNFNVCIGPEDSYKFLNVDENMALTCGSSLLSVEGRPTSLVTNDTIPLKIWQYRHSNYYLEFTGSDFPATAVAVLKDSYLHQDQIINLSGVTILNFALTADTASSASNRFCVVLKPAGTLPLSMLDFTASQKENGILLGWTMADEADVSNYEIQKSADAVSFAKAATVQVSTTSGGNISHQWLDKEMMNEPVFYRVKMVGKTGEVRLSKIIKVQANIKTMGISIYPNPVRGNVMGLQLLNLEKNIYQVRLYNSGGQQVYATTVLHNGGSATQSVSIGKSLVKGSYTLVVTNGKIVFNKNVLIE